MVNEGVIIDPASLAKDNGCLLRLDASNEGAASFKPSLKQEGQSDLTKFSSYLAGLIEGDGCIYVPKSGGGTPQIIIVFNAKDFPLALILQKALNCGSISKIKGKNAYALRIGNLEGLKSVVNYINGYMRTQKISELYKLID